MSISKVIHLLGFASGLAGPNSSSGEGALKIQRSPYLTALKEIGVNFEWQDMLTLDKIPQLSKLSMIAQHCQKLALQTHELVKDKNFFTVIGGDHSCAIGTWSGVYHTLKKEGDLGLIWIDAHMDSHTPHTSQTGNVHGMPLASLLGHGMSSLTGIFNSEPKLKPEHVSLIGVRSFESGEAALLKELNVRVFFMEEVKQRGLNAVMQEALTIATQGTAGFGLSIDIDSIDPKDAPGTGVAEPDGILGQDLCEALIQVARHPRLLGAEIVEFDPQKDKNHITEKLIASLISVIALGKYDYEFFKNNCFCPADADL
jgi:arginase